MRISRVEEVSADGQVQVVHDTATAQSRESSSAPSCSPWPEPLAPEAFHGLTGEVISAIEPHSEADPAAVLLQFQIAFGNVIGRSAFFSVEQHRHHTNLFGLVVGVTSKSRKGTSYSRTAALFERVDPSRVSNRVHGGVGSGEGIIWAVRDPIYKRNRKGEEELTDEGVADKRRSTENESLELR